MTKTHFVPHRAGTIGMWLFLASLAMLFISSMLGYVLIRFTHNAPSLGFVKLPSSLLISTIVILLGSWTIHRALIAVRRERQTRFRVWLSATIVLAAAFVAIQAPAMAKLWQENEAARTAAARAIAADPVQSNLPTWERRQQPPNTYAFVMILVLVHALHVVGGVIGLAVVAVKGFAGHYDHEHHAGVRNAVLYWHFLDVVWLFMYTLIFALG